jgi:nucleotide-binding universal stress UspA family protein
VFAPSPSAHELEKRYQEWASRYRASLARDNLQDAAADAQQRDIPVHVSTVEGHAPTEIVGFAEENGVDLIVMSTRGRAGLSRWLMGSVADRVIRGTDVPVLLVRAGNGNKRGSDGKAGGI